MADTSQQKVNAQISKRPFLGRQPYLDEFTATVRQVAAGNDEGGVDLPHIFLISGQTGGGKSRLLDELYLTAQREAAIGHCRVQPVIRLEEAGLSIPRTREAEAVKNAKVQVARYLADKLILNYTPTDRQFAVITNDVSNEAGNLAIGTNITQFRVEAVGVLNYSSGTAQPNIENKEYEKYAAIIRAALHKQSADLPLVVLLDTYELVDIVDQELRSIYLGSGRRVIWVVAGRTDLVHDRTTSTGILRGYASTSLGEKLHDFSQLELTVSDLTDYLAALEVEVTLPEAEALLKVTARNALALVLAVRLYLSGHTLAEITREETSPLLRSMGKGREAPIYQMMQKLLWYCPSADKPSLYSLALLRYSDIEILEQVLPREVGQSVQERLDELGMRYEFVLADRLRLHDTAAHFLRAWLMEQAAGGGERELVASMSGKIATANLTLLQRYEVDKPAPTIEQRMQDTTWAWSHLLPYLDAVMWHDPDAGSWELIVAAAMALGYERGVGAAAMTRGLELLPRYPAAVKDRLAPLRNIGSFDNLYPSEAELTLFLQMLEGTSKLPISWHPKGAAAWDEAIAALYWQIGRYYDPADYIPTRKSDRAKAIKLYEQAFQIYPSVGLCLTLGKAYDWERRFADAVRCYGVGIDLEPNNSRLYDERGNTYLRGDDIDRAVADFRRGEELRGDGYASYFLARAYAKRGDAEKTLAQLRLVIASNPVYRTFPAKDIHITQLRKMNAKFARELESLVGRENLEVVHLEVRDRRSRVCLATLITRKRNCSARLLIGW